MHNLWIQPNTCVRTYVCTHTHTVTHMHTHHTPVLASDQSCGWCWEQPLCLPAPFCQCPLVNCQGDSSHTSGMHVLYTQACVDSLLNITLPYAPPFPRYSHCTRQAYMSIHTTCKTPFIPHLHLHTHTHLTHTSLTTANQDTLPAKCRHHMWVSIHTTQHTYIHTYIPPDHTYTYNMSINT